jgi:hypothetical protein
MVQVAFAQSGGIAAQPGDEGVEGSGEFQVLQVQPCHTDVGGMMELRLREGTILKRLEQMGITTVE